MIALWTPLCHFLLFHTFANGAFQDPDDVENYFFSKYESMVFLEGGSFRTGINDPSSRTGEYPVYNSHVRAYYIDRYPVTNAQFRKFKQTKTRFRTEAEEKDFSSVFGNHISDGQKDSFPKDPYQDGWYNVPGATWNKPEGFISSISERMSHPVVHVSHDDAYAYCFWVGKRLPTDMEWEYAARGGLDNQAYPWGDRYMKMRMNVWQGTYPSDDKKYDGFDGTSPVDAFPTQNDYGMYDMLGNVWEWTSTKYFERVVDRTKQPLRYTLKGGSFIDTRDGNYNYIVRTANKLGRKPDYTSGYIGFRCVMDMTKEELYARLHATTTTPKPIRIHRKEEMFYDEFGKPRKKKKKIDSHKEL